MRIQRLDDNLAEAYDAFLKRSPRTLAFYSNAYRRLLKSFLGCEDHYLLAMEGDEIVGALPLCLSSDVTGATDGCVINSLPFYGSNGGVVTPDDTGAVHEALLNAYLELAKDRGAWAGTVVLSPYDEQVEQYERWLPVDRTDDRIGQITELPESSSELMAFFESKTRRSVRQSDKAGVTVRRDDSGKAFEFLGETHRAGMAEIGGRAKPQRFFEAVASCLADGTERTLYVASIGEEDVAALLLFRFGQVVEYITPVTDGAFKDKQAMSGLVFRAMSDACDDGFRYWNWGGTWRSQDGVYRFKRRWGAGDRPYRYLTTLFDDRILKIPTYSLSDCFPYFYVYPY